jgi:hypothetical protein
MELDRRGAELLFQVLTEREEKNSVAIASDESFSGWTKTFTDPDSAPPSSTASFSAATSSRPAPTPTASPPPEPEQNISPRLDFDANSRPAGVSGTRSASAVQPIAWDQLTNAIEVSCRPSAGQDRTVVVSQEHVLAEEPPGSVFLAGGIHRERQPGSVRRQQLDAVFVRGEEVAEILTRVQGLGQNDLDEAEGKALQPVLPPLGAPVREVGPDEHGGVVALEAVEEEAPGCGSLVLVPEDQSLPGVIHIQLVWGEQLTWLLVRSRRRPNSK